jgi:hypothetical protein
MLIALEETAEAERLLGAAGIVPEGGVGVAVVGSGVGVRVGVAVGPGSVGVRVGVRVGGAVGRDDVGVRVGVGVGALLKVRALATFE